jgi:hypothetical protein
MRHDAKGSQNPQLPWTGIPVLPLSPRSLDPDLVRRSPQALEPLKIYGYNSTHSGLSWSTVRPLYSRGRDPIHGLAGIWDQ